MSFSRLIGVLGFLGIGLGIGFGSAKAEELKVADKAPDFFLPVYNPEKSGMDRFFLEQEVGPTAKNPKKVLLLSFFNIDCAPCRKELPYLQSVYDRYRKDGLAITVVNCDSDKEKIAEVVRYLAEAKFTFPVLKDRFQLLQRKYAVESFPTLFILDKDQRIVNIRVGYNERGMPFPLALIQKLLGVPADSSGKKGS